MYHHLKLHGKYGVGKYALVNVDGFELVKNFRWYLNKEGYVMRSQHISGSGKKRKKKIVILARLLMDAPKNKVVDHINRDPLDNRKENLRICSRSQNEANSPSRGGTSQFKGVHWDKKTERWISGIKLKYKKFILGSFESEIEAAKVYDKKAREFFGEFAYLNKV